MKKLLLLFSCSLFVSSFSAPPGRRISSCPINPIQLQAILKKLSPATSPSGSTVTTPRSPKGINSPRSPIALLRQLYDPNSSLASKALLTLEGGEEKENVCTNLSNLQRINRCLAQKEKELLSITPDKKQLAATLTEEIQRLNQKRAALLMLLDPDGRFGSN